MKRVFYALLLILSVLSCKKQLKTESFLEKVKATLRDSLPNSDYASLDFSHCIFSKSDQQRLHFLRVPIQGKNLSEDFLIVKTDGTGNVEQGRFVHMATQISLQKPAQVRVDGMITITTLTKKEIVHSTIVNGHITEFHSSPNALLRDDNTMPEVVIVAYVNYDYGVDFSTWLWLNSLFYNSDGGGGYNGGDGYSSIDGGGYSGGGYDSGAGGGGSTTGSDGVPTEDLKDFEPEFIYDVLPIDVWKYFNCFDNIPSAGATYTIKLCADVPSNTNPQASSANSAASAGHSFLTITKTNGIQKLTQSFGFYPLNRPSVFDPFTSVTSTIKDNGGIEYNASIEMTITDAQFAIIKNNAISWSTLSYNLGSYNCTNYALDIFNSVRSNPITLSPYKIVLPGSTDPYSPSSPNVITIDKSPQMLFMQLQQMKNSNDPEAANITIDQTHNSLSPLSKGECN